MVTLLHIIDTMAVSRGEKKGNNYHLTTTTEELMPLVGLKPSASHHRYVKTMVERSYPGTSAEALGHNGSEGFRLHIKIWSK